MTAARPQTPTAHELHAVHAHDARGTAAVELRSVSRTFPGGGGVRDLTLTLYAGEFFSLLGPSGCGKTTTLRIIAGFEHPDAGEVLVEGVDVQRLPPNRRPVNTVFQNYALFSHLDVYGNVEFGLREKRVPRAGRRESIREALALVRLDGYEDRRPSQLSGGEQQRVALARAIVNRPALLLLDEPLGALDLKLRRAMQEELKEIQRRLGMTFLYVTHDQEEALMMSDRIGLMRQGRLEQVGLPEEIYERPKSAYAADFIGEANILRGKIAFQEQGRALIVLDIGSTIAAGCEDFVEKGTRGAAILRPERITLRPGGEEPKNASNTLLGTVDGAYFIGSHRRIRVHLTGDTYVVVNAQDYDAGVYGHGAQVELHLDPEKVWFLPEGS